MKYVRSIKFNSSRRAGHGPCAVQKAFHDFRHHERNLRRSFKITDSKMSNKSSSAAALAVLGCFCVAFVLIVCFILLLALPPSPSWPTREPQFVWWWLVFGILFLFLMFLLLAAGFDESASRGRWRYSADDGQIVEVDDSSWVFGCCLVVAMLVVVAVVIVITVFATTTTTTTSTKTWPVTNSSKWWSNGGSTAENNARLAIIVVLIILIISVPLVSICICFAFAYDREASVWTFKRRRARGSAGSEGKAAAPIQHNAGDVEEGQIDADEGEHAGLISSSRAAQSRQHSDGQPSQGEARQRAGGSKQPAPSHAATAGATDVSDGAAAGVSGALAKGA